MDYDSETIPQPVENTDREIWRETEGDFYSPSIHVTGNGRIGMNVGGHVIVMPVEKWHMLGMQDLLAEFKTHFSPSSVREPEEVLGFSDRDC